MADNTHDNQGPARTDHRRTYDAFMGAMKWGTVAVAIVLILMAIFLVR